MTAEEIRQILAWLEESGIAAFELRTPQGGLRLRLADGPTPRGNAPPAPTDTPRCIRSPAVGVFLDAHPWLGEPLASPGTRVAAGAVVGLLRVGQLYRPVVAPRDGILGQRLTAPGTLVDFARPLLELLPATEPGSNDPGSCQ
jgi:hypothetical protein